MQTKKKKKNGNKVVRQLLLRNVSIFIKETKQNTYFFQSATCKNMLNSAKKLREINKKNKSRYRQGTAVPLNIENKCKYYVLNTKQNKDKLAKLYIYI